MLAENNKNSRHRIVLILCCLGLPVLLALLAGSLILAKSYFPVADPFAEQFKDNIHGFNGALGPEAPPGIPEKKSPSIVDGRRLNILLFGIDANEENLGRTDTIILASIDAKNNKVGLLSIPRDTRVQITGYGWDKVNHAMVYGGPELSVRTVSDLLGIPLHYYILTDFNGFKKIVDIIGGVTIDVEQNMNRKGIDLKEGVQRLNGDGALMYVRYRDYPMGDIERIEHQLKFLKALADEVLYPGSISTLPDLAPEITGCVKTNLAVGDLCRLAAATRNITGDNIMLQVLPGSFVTIDDISYWDVAPNSAQAAAKIFNNEGPEARPLAP